MKFSDGLNKDMFDFEEEYGKLRFISLRGEEYMNDDDGEQVVRKRTYMLLSEKKQAFIRVGIPASTPELKIGRDQYVEMVNPVMKFMARPRPLELVEYIEADTLRPVGAQQPNQPPKGKPEQPQTGGEGKK